MKKLLLLIPLALALAGCSAIETLQEASEQVKILVEAVKAADTDQSGSTDSKEWIAWLTGGGGLAVVLGLIRWLALKIGGGDAETMKALNQVAEKLSSAKAQLWPEVTALKEKVLTIEAKADKPT